MALFKILIKEAAPTFFVRCSKCKHEFWVDSTTEENLIRDYTSGYPILIEKCPNCGAIRTRY
jgi:NAD-dependent SIR2 family protein deacetylase